MNQNGETGRKSNQLTNEETRDGVLEVNQARQIVNTILFGFVRIVDLDENDALFAVKEDNSNGW